MTIVQSALTALLALSAIPAFAQEVDIQVPGVSVDVSGGSASVKVDGIGTITNKGVDFNTGDVQVRAEGPSQANTGASVPTVRIEAPGLTVQTTGGTQVLTAEHTLSTVVNTGVTTADARRIVALEGDESVYIRTEDDVAAYAHMVQEHAPQVAAVETSDTGVSVTYFQPGKLFGLFDLTMKARVVVDAEGSVSIKLPWYSFLVTKDTATLAASVQEAVNTTGSAAATADASFTPVEQVRIVQQVAQALPASVVVNGEDVSVTSGNSSVEVKDGNVRIEHGAN